jgi:uncharacterized protein YjiS (DUF1127 family)
MSIGNLVLGALLAAVVLIAERAAVQVAPRVRRWREVRRFRRALRSLDSLVPWWRAALSDGMATDEVPEAFPELQRPQRGWSRRPHRDTDPFS